ncbi:MAG: quinone-dependent dihydroorotate dehydrogenase [Alphaproteobacteria bacterium]|nr:quinone-dependent dihydroorotate dehydrogenase [Alphaproteobacteria bacterium]
MSGAIALRLLRLFDAETAHRLTIRALACGLGPRDKRADPPELAVELFGLRFPNPIGLAAGFDKNAEVPDAMLALGLGFVEVGTVTPRPQSGNPKPRIFRLEEDRAVINRLGFNNEGMERAAIRLRYRQGRPGIVGVNIGANKDASDRISDYVAAFRRLAGLASYVTINISSPNTPGLRGLQDRENLEELVRRVLDARGEAGLRAPVLVKVAPDLDAEARAAIAEIALTEAIDGLIATNTTVSRPSTLKSKHAVQAGGLSGKPLFAPSTEVLKDLYRLTRGKTPLIGVGGISSGADAYAKIRAGASAVQLYTALAYDGARLVRTIKHDLAECLRKDGLRNVMDAIGKDAVPY